MSITIKNEQANQNQAGIFSFVFLTPSVPLTFWSSEWTPGGWANSYLLWVEGSMNINGNVNENITLIPKAIKLTGRSWCRFKRVCRHEKRKCSWTQMMLSSGSCLLAACPWQHFSSTLCHCAPTELQPMIILKIFKLSQPDTKSLHESLSDLNGHWMWNADMKCQSWLQKWNK